MNTLRGQIEWEGYRKPAAKKPASFKLDPEIIAAIEDEAKRYRVTKSAVVRAAIRLALLFGSGIEPFL